MSHEAKVKLAQARDDCNDSCFQSDRGVAGASTRARVVAGWSTVRDQHPAAAKNGALHCKNGTVLLAVNTKLLDRARPTLGLRH